MGGGSSKKKSYEADPDSETEGRSSTRSTMHPLGTSPNINGKNIVTKSCQVVQRNTIRGLSVTGTSKYDPENQTTAFLRTRFNIDVQGGPISDLLRFGEEQLGSGFFGIICAAYSRSDEKESGEISKMPSAAVKTVSKCSLKTQDDFEKVMTEVTLLHKLNSGGSGCPNLLKMVSFYDNVDSYHLVFEPVTGKDLFSHIIRLEGGQYQESTARDMFKQIITGLSFLHSKSVVHRDLKPENFLITATGVIKISDFSLAQQLTGEEAIFSPFAVSGTPGYAAPEILNGELYAHSADLFSAGVILYILLGGFPPFDISAETKYYPKHEFTRPFFETVSEEGRGLVNKLLSQKSEERGTASEALADKWMLMEGGGQLSEGLGRMKEWDAKRKFRVVARSVTSAMKIAKSVSKIGLGSPSNANAGDRLTSFSAASVEKAIDANE